MLENQATNLITYPISYGNSYWTKSGASIEGDPSTAGVEQVTNGTFTGVANGTDVITLNGWSAYGSPTNRDIQSEALRITTTGANMGAKLDITTVVGSMYLLTYTYTGNISAIAIDGGYGGNGITTFYFTAVSTTTAIYFQANGNSAGETVYDNVSVKEVQGYSSPSVDFPTSAFKLVQNTNTGYHYISQSVNATGDYVYSIYVKKGEYEGISLLLPHPVSSVNAVSSFNLLTGSFTTNNHEATSLNMNNDWYRLSLKTKLSGTHTFSLYVNQTIQQSETGDGTSGIYLFMSQLEQGSYATSPTLTSLSAEGTTTTRVAEVCTGAGDASTFNDSEGVLMAEISALSDDLTNRMIVITDGTTTNSIQLAYIPASNKIAYYIKVGGVNSAVFEYQYSDITQGTKIAVTWKLNDFKFYVNGFKVGEDLSGAVYSPNTLNQLNFKRSDGFPFYGKTKQLQIFSSELTSAELETLTSWTSFISMANSQNYNII